MLLEGDFLSKIELIFRDNMAKHLNKIKEKFPESKFYSHSRLETFNQCKRNYYWTYIDKKPQKPGVYGLLGEAAHTSLEMLYTGQEKQLNKKYFDNAFDKCELFGINFPKSKYDIKGNYKKDINNFYNVYKPIDGKNKQFISELGFILKIDNLHYLIGYIDLLVLNDDDTCEIVDFKTSSWYSDKDLSHHGYQLVLYKMAIEQLYNIPVNTVSWQFLKYCQVQIGNNKPKEALQGRNWVDKCSSQIRTLMKKKGYDNSTIDIYLSEAIINNHIDNLPDDVRNEISVNVQTRYYDVTDEVKQEYLDYVKNSIKQIETMGESEDLYELSVDQFFCQNLCGFSDICKWRASK